MSRNELPPEQRKVTRIDMYEAGKNGVLVLRFADGWTASSNPVQQHSNTEKTLDEMVAWLKENGWHVYEWPGGGPGSRGARAFLGRPLPVRSKYGILYKRRFMSDHPFLWAADERPRSNIDLAFEY